ncbi:MAG: Uma2 family endonuclease [Gemmatimonadaceae bacterium]|nr:Uma2 family endonuclease [Gemmatimonadaceae bacterium]
MPLLQHYWTPEDIERLPETGGKQECLGGVLFLTPAPALPHAVTGQELAIALGEVCAQRRVVQTVIGLRHEDSMLEPDLVVLREPLTTSVDALHYADVVLLIEVASPGTVRRDRGMKREHYQAMGVPEYWSVNAQRRIIERWGPTRAATVYDSGTINWSDPVTGRTLSLDVERFFSALWGETPR